MADKTAQITEGQAAEISHQIRKLDRFEHLKNITDPSLKALSHELKARLPQQPNMPAQSLSVPKTEEAPVETRVGKLKIYTKKD